MPIVPDRYRGTPEYDAVRERMIQAARSREGTVYYRPEISRLLGIPDDENGDHVVEQMARVCGEISEDEHQAGRRMLSAVVINRQNHPGGGFFTLARALGHRFGSDDEFWLQEHRAVVTYWTNHRE